MTEDLRGHLSQEGLDQTHQLFDEWCDLELVRYGVTWTLYRDLRREGRWNRYVDDELCPRGGCDDWKTDEED